MIADSPFQFEKKLFRFARLTQFLRAGAFGYTTNRLEGVSNKIKVLKCTAYGYRDEEYIFLRFKRELPSKGRLSMIDFLAQTAVINGVAWQGAWISG